MGIVSSGISILLWLVFGATVQLISTPVMYLGSIALGFVGSSKGWFTREI